MFAGPYSVCDQGILQGTKCLLHCILWCHGVVVSVLFTGCFTISHIVNTKQKSHNNFVEEFYVFLFSHDTGQNNHAF